MNGGEERPDFGSVGQKHGEKKKEYGETGQDHFPFRTDKGRGLTDCLF